jgi:hypothetical protein
MEKRKELTAKTAKSVLGEQQQKREKRDSAKESPEDMALSGFVDYKTTQASFGRNHLRNI